MPAGIALSENGAARANMGVDVADYDRSGRPHLAVGNFLNEMIGLYHNQDGKTFIDRAPRSDVGRASLLSVTWAVMFLDYDLDGFLDLFAVNGGTDESQGMDARARLSQPPLLLRNRGNGTFENVSASLGPSINKPIMGRGGAYLDFDGDGDLDLFIGFRDRANAMYRNDAGRFTDIAASVGLADARKTVGAVWFDYDEDGDLDVAVANMDGDANGLFRNNGGSFTDVAAAAGVEWGGRAPKSPANGTVRVCAADVDADGHFDLFAANYGPLAFFSNRGKGTFEDRSAAWAINIDSRYDSCAFEDFDHDGRLDLYVNGTVTGGASWQDTLFRNTGSAMVDVTPPAIRKLQADHGVQWADVDGDGDVDLALTGSRPDGMHFIMRNMLPATDAARSVFVRVVDGKGNATRAGAEVRVYAAGTSRLLGARLVDSGSGYDSQNDMPAHVGVPAGVSKVDVQVIVPRHGARTPIWQRGASLGKPITVRTN